MFEVEYLIFCESKGVDDRGRLSLINIFDTIFAVEYPVAYPQLRVVTKLTAKNKAILNKAITIKLTTNIGGEEITQLEGTSKVTIEKGNSLVPDLDLSHFAFPEQGDYTVKLFVNDSLLAERILKVRSASDLQES